jgi:hypothetical protein
LNISSLANAKMVMMGRSNWSNRLLRRNLKRIMWGAAMGMVLMQKMMMDQHRGQQSQLSETANSSMGMRVEPYLYGIVPPPAYGDTEPPQRLEVGGSTPRATANQSANEFSAATSSSVAAGDELSAAQSSSTAKDPKTKHDNSNNVSIRDAQFHYCPAPDERVDATFPIGMPQKLTAVGRFRAQTGAPFITQDFWLDLVDNRRTFFLRPLEKGFPRMEKLRDWIRSRPHPITLVMNNQRAKSWPADLNNKDYELILNETNLHAVYAGNPRKLEKYPKLKPLPVGLKWQFENTRLF